MVSRREKETEFKKQLIAEAAFQLFSQTWYENVTVEEIARKAEFGKGTIYKYFASKEEIIAYIMCQGIDEICVRIEEQCLSEPNLMKALSNYISLQYHFYMAYHHIFLSLMRRAIDGTANSQWFTEINGRHEKKTNMVAEILNRGMTEKYIAEADAFKMARVLEKVIKGFTIEAQREKGTDVEKDLELIKAVLSHGILLNKGGE
ncbi:MAG: TetR/AcrR family transcriptional regulator [Chitinophagales bacterium]